MADIEFIVTGDGSHSLVNTALNETYHSRHGAMRESQYVFIEQGLKFLLKKSSPANVSILEVGFGTGLNAWLTWSESKRLAIKIHYHSLETYPLPPSVWQQLNYVQTDVEKNEFAQLHASPWGNAIPLSQNFILQKIEQSVQQFDSGARTVNLVYFDAFAPNKQPALWELPILKKVTDMLEPQGVFVTYCAKGQLKRDLRSLGMDVASLPGPPGKREMIRATKL